ISTFSYNSVAFLSGSFFLCFGVRYFTRRIGWVAALYLFLAICFGLSARFSLGLLEIATALILIVRSRSRILILATVCAIQVSVGLAYAYPVFSQNIAEVLALSAKSSHRGLF